MRIAVYPGSFNPWHKGHQDVITKAICIFDRVIIAQGTNPNKKLDNKSFIALKNSITSPYVNVMKFDGLFVDFVESLKNGPLRPVAVIKGLRNGSDLEYEKTQQYWNEDLGLDIPVFYIISDRKLTHISSSAIRAIESLK